MASEPVTLDIASLSHDGRGISTLNGKTIFISGAITGEKVICQILKKNSRYNEANTLDVLHAAAERALPVCSHYGVCGGCSMQHIEQDSQIQFKQKILLEQLAHFGKVTPEKIIPPLSGNTMGYRRKARLGVRYVKKKNKILVGFREKFSNFLTDIQRCPVLHPSVGMRIQELSELIASLSVFDHIPQIEVAAGDKKTALVFRHMMDLTADDKNKLVIFAQRHHFDIYLQPNPPLPLEKLYPADEKMLLEYSLSDYSIQIQFHPLDFIQVNGEMNHLMIQQALTLLNPQAEDIVLDLFCGLGNFTLPIARFAKHVTGVEGSHEMVARASNNAVNNGIKNVEFHMANLMGACETFRWATKKYDKILLDPPRTGAKEILPLLSTSHAKRIVYISCNPATLARDAGELVHHYHYKLKEVGVINMFPQTSHIEAIAMFEK